MSEPEIVTLETHLQRIEVKPGDVFVLQCEHPMSQQQLDQIQEVWHRFIGSGHKLVVLDNGMKLGVLSNWVTVKE